MRIIDENGMEVTSPDLTKGKLVSDTILVKHHPEVLPIEEKWHYEVITVYPNGGEDIERVIDVEAVEGKPAWDEYEDVIRYVLYTKEELDKMAEEEKNSIPSRVSDLEEALHMILTGVTA